MKDNIKFYSNNFFLDQLHPVSPDWKTGLWTVQKWFLRPFFDSPECFFFFFFAFRNSTVMYMYWSGSIFRWKSYRNKQ